MIKLSYKNEKEMPEMQNFDFRIFLISFCRYHKKVYR